MYIDKDIDGYIPIERQLDRFFYINKPMDWNINELIVIYSWPV